MYRQQFGIHGRFKIRNCGFDVRGIRKNCMQLGLDNARALLPEVARDYLEHSIIAETMDKQYGFGITEYVGHAIQDYCGV